MSASYLDAVNRRSEDALAVSPTCPPWEELPAPAILAAALHLARMWPDQNAALVAMDQCCRSWRVAVLQCDAVWDELCNTSGLVHRSRASYLKHRILRGGLLDKAFNSCHSYSYQVIYSRSLLRQPRIAPSPTARFPAIVNFDQARKCNSAPDTSWVFSERGYCAATDRVAWFTVHVHTRHDEIRVGFTDDREALMRGRAGMTYNEPHAWLYSDGSTVSGAYEAGRRPASVVRGRPTPWPKFTAGDAVTVRLDFEADEASWFLGLNEDYPAHAHTMHGLPKATLLYAAVVMDEAGDEIRFDPFVPRLWRRKAETMLRLARQYTDKHDVCMPRFMLARLRQASMLPLQWGCQLAAAYITSSTLRSGGVRSSDHTNNTRSDTSLKNGGQGAYAHPAVASCGVAAPDLVDKLLDGGADAVVDELFDKWLPAVDLDRTLTILLDRWRCAAPPQQHVAFPNANAGIGGEFLGWQPDDGDQD